MAEAIELWGTFSVADHLRPQSFVMDTLLYDRLVIPVPAEDVHERDWRERWDKEKLKRLTDVLGDLAVTMPWGPDQVAAWQTHMRPPADRPAMASAITEDMRDLQRVDPDLPAFHVTRRILAAYANNEVDNQFFAKLKALAKRPGTKVEAVSAYGSPRELAEGLGLRRAATAEENQGTIAPAAVLDWAIHVPVGSDPIDLLAKAKSVAARKDFREHRSYFYTRLRELRGLETEEVRRDLHKRLADYRGIMQDQGWQTTARRATQVLRIPASLLTLIAPITGGLSSLAIDIVSTIVTEIRTPEAPDEMARIAAMAYDIEAEFGERIDYRIWH